MQGKIIRTFVKFLGGLLLLSGIYYVSDFSFDSHIKSWSFGRYTAYDYSYALVDNYMHIGIEPYIYSYEVRFPYIYVVGRGGFTKILNNPIVPYIEKLPNYSGYQINTSYKVSMADDNIEDMKKKYGMSLVVHNSFTRYSSKDQDIFRNMLKVLENDKGTDSVRFLYDLMNK